MLGMGVRLASALTTGFLVCIVSDIQSDDPKAPIGLGQIEGQYIASLTTSAAHDPHCHDQVASELILVNFWQVVSPRFERLSRSWVKELYMNILMKYPSFLMILQVNFLQMMPEKI